MYDYLVVFRDKDNDPITDLVEKSNSKFKESKERIKINDVFILLLMLLIIERVFYYKRKER